MRWVCFHVLLAAACASPRVEPVTSVPTTTAAQIARPAATASASSIVAEGVAPEPVGMLREPDRVIARLRPKFRQCYERGLAEDPQMAGGAVVVQTRVGPDGAVRSTDVKKLTGLSPRVASCIAQQLEATNFGPPGGVATLDVPVHFVRATSTTAGARR